MELSILYLVVPFVIIGLIVGILKSRTKTIPAVLLMGTVAVVVVGAVLVPILDDAAQTYPPTYNWTYDDYLAVKDIAESSGALELIQIDGTTYAHAKDVGEGTLTTKSGNTAIYTVAKAPLDIFLAVGQSNIAYYLYDVNTAGPASTLGTTYYYGASNSPISLTGQDAVIAGSYDTTFSSYGMYDMVNSDNKSHIGNIDGPFSARYHALTGHKVYYVNSAVAGTAIEAFAPGQSQYNFMMGVLDNALDQVDPNKFEIVSKTVFFCQSWSLTNSQGYIEIFDALYSALESKGFGDWYIIREPRSNGAVAYDSQTTIIRTYDNVWLGSNTAGRSTVHNGLLLPDGVHFSQQGDNRISEDLINSLSKNRTFLSA